LESEFFVLTAPREHKKDGSWASRKIRPVSHSEWAAKHPSKCLNSKESLSANSDSGNRPVPNTPVANSLLPSRRGTTTQSLPDDKEASSSTEASSRDKKPVIEQEQPPSDWDDDVSFDFQRNHSIEPGNDNANSHGNGSPKNSSGGDSKSSRQPVFSLKRWCPYCNEPSNGVGDGEDYPDCQRCGEKIISVGGDWLKAPISDAEGKRNMEQMLQPDPNQTELERRKLFTFASPAYRRWIAMTKYADELATVLAENGKSPMSGTNGLKELFDQFAALKDDPQAMWAFYDALSTPLKILIWDKFPEHHETLRAEECKDGPR
jgi:hypothetical protein